MGYEKHRWLEGEVVHATGMNHLETQYDAAVALMNERGTVDAYYVHDQNEPAEVWIITHPLSKQPSVTIVDSAGTVVHGMIEYLDDSRIRVTFTGGFSGRAFLN
ncbi:MAG: hypothetical protein WCK39_08070 [Methanomassiliicoccales archaeon]